MRNLCSTSASPQLIQILTSKRINLLYTVTLTVLCSLSYFFGSYLNSGFSTAVHQASSVFTTPPEYCGVSSNNNINSTLDFVSRHAANDSLFSRRLDGFGSKNERNSGDLKRYEACDVKYSEYTPCHDAKRSLKFPRGNLIYRHARKERHCPEKKEELLKCLIPAPYGYKTPFHWPESRDKVWYANVPHKWLTVEKAGQNWVRFEGDRFSFPGGGTMFPDGADAYINQIAKAGVNLKDGSIRTAIDTGCGVASWGAYLMSRDILPLSFAPKDTHDAQVQFALERGVPATIGIIATQRLPYPSRAFDMAHCSRCLIPWSKHDGIYLAEVDRILRPGGYWILSGPPINWEVHWRGWKRTKQDLNDEQLKIEEIAKGLCWKKMKQKGDIAVWRKPTNHLHCNKYKRMLKNHDPPFCNNTAHKPDQAWYTNLDTCLTPLPQASDVTKTAGGEVPNWPKRLNTVPPRILSGSLEGVTAKNFEEDVNKWRKTITHYKSINPHLAKSGRYRNLLDMNPGFGGFAASMINEPVWVMNVVPIEAKLDTLGVIFERGLIGTYHSWCEAMSTYPRTYDFVYADSVFSLYEGKCDMEDILLEIDRILRPEGSVVFVDDVDVVVRIKKYTDGMRWDSRIYDHENGPLHRHKLLVAVKNYWTSPAPAAQPLTI